VLGLDREQVLFKTDQFIEKTVTIYGRECLRKIQFVLEFQILKKQKTK